MARVRAVTATTRSRPVPYRLARDNRDNRDNGRGAPRSRGGGRRDGAAREHRALGGGGGAGLLSLRLPPPSSPQPGATAPPSLHAAPFPPPFSHLTGGTPGGPYGSRAAIFRLAGGRDVQPAAKHKIHRGERGGGTRGGGNGGCAAATETSLPLWAGKRQSRA